MGYYIVTLLTYATLFLYKINIKSERSERSQKQIPKINMSCTPVGVRSTPRFIGLHRIFTSQVNLKFWN